MPDHALSSPGRAALAWPIGLCLALALPACLLVVNGDWIYINPYIPPWFDPFVYLGLLRHPADLVLHPTYYPTTRVPWIAFGSAFYALLPDVLANAALKLTLFAGTVLLVVLSLGRLGGAAPAVATALLLAAYPFFVQSVGWDYLEGLISLLIAACYAAATFGGLRAARWRTLEGLLGAAAVVLLACNLFTVVFLPPLTLFYLAVLVRAGRASLRNLAFGGGAMAGGALVGALVLSGIAAALGGDPWFLKVQIEAVFRLSAQRTGVTYESWTPLLPYATWLAIPGAVGIASLVVGGIAAFRSLRDPGAGADRFMALVALHYLLILALFVVVTAVSLAALLVWFYTSYLIVSAFVTLGCILGYLQRGRRPAPVWPWAAAFILLMAIYVRAIGLPLQTALGFGYGAPLAVQTAIWAGVAVLVILGAQRLRSSTLTLLGVVVLCGAYLAMINQPQLSHAHAKARRPGFQAMNAAVDLIRSVSDHPRRYVWTDRLEQPYGGLFHSIWCQSMLSSRDAAIGFESATQLPALPPHGFRAGDPIVVLTANPDWRALAEPALAARSLGLRVTRTHTIAFDDVRFEAIVAEITSTQG